MSFPFSVISRAVVLLGNQRPVKFKVTSGCPLDFLPLSLLTSGFDLESPTAPRTEAPRSRIEDKWNRRYRIRCLECCETART